jgi:peroxin-19
VKDHPEIPADERKRYDEQITRIQKVVAIFEDPSYKEDQATSEKIVELMNEVRPFFTRDSVSC